MLSYCAVLLHGNDALQCCKEDFGIDMVLTAGIGDAVEARDRAACTA